MRAMITEFRGTLNSFQKSTKELILKTTMIILLSLGVLFIFISTSSYSQSPQNKTPYAEFLSHYREKYLSEQTIYRKFAFYETHDELVFQQKQLDQRFKEGLNNFINITEQEFQQFYTIVTSLAKEKGYTEIAEFQDNYFYDWEQFMPPAKNMRDYDGSFIFAAMGSVEFELNKQQILYYRALNENLEKDKNWITLSEQEIIDCCSHCLEKKRPEYVYKYILENGISRQEEYPYVSSIFHSEPGECKGKNSFNQFKIKSWTPIKGCQDLNDRLANGPVVVHVDAREWRDYNGGILTSCGNVRNHYALLVGRGIGYWKIRNSWGRLWGEHGHIKIKSGNTCGICGHSSFVNVQ